MSENNEILQRMNFHKIVHTLQNLKQFKLSRQLVLIFDVINKVVKSFKVAH